MSTLVTNTITGLSTAANITLGSTPVVSASANSLTVRGEGSAQTSVQQGLVKCWSNVVGNGTAISDSFNLTSLTDNATGSFTKTIANDMASINYSVSGMIAPLSSQSAENIARCMNIDHGTAMTATAYRVHCVSSTNGGTNVGLEDNLDTMTQVVGDLA